MKDIIDKYIIKSKNYINLNFVYNDNIINKELKFKEQANEIDIKNKKMKILVYNKDKNNNNIETKIIKSKDIICPECKENILINIKDYRINLNECKNNHSRNNIKLEEYENTQKIGLSKIECDKCKNIYNKYNNEFYICYSCNIILCSSCKINHNNSHNIINYNDKNYICNKHNKWFIKYCKECKENICKLCENEHKNHNIINIKDMILDKADLKKENEK